MMSVRRSTQVVEGVGLENREAPQGARGFESLLLRHKGIENTNAHKWRLLSETIRYIL
jgi:hypothetical protein